VSATDYAAVVEAQIAERVDFAFYGPFGYVVATNAGAEIEAIIAQIPEPDEPPGYQSYLVTTADRDDINEIEDIRGRTVCLVDPSSTSGGLFPTSMMLDADIDPDTDVTAVYSGAHDASVLSVLSGDCDAGFAFDTMVDMILPDRGYYEPDEIKIIAKSETIPGSPIAVGQWLPQDLIDAIQETIVELNAEARWGAAAVEDEYYDGVRLVCELTGAPACEP
jgi:phosphonate transport system substrate-binding protein